MSEDTRFSLKRWSARKLEASRAAASAPPSASAASEAPPAPSPTPQAAALPASPAPASAAELPPVESLDFSSDFAAFMRPKVAEDLKRSALKKLFRDPRFNVMDGLDVYIDDYSIPSPLEPEIVREMVQARYIFDPPKTRVNAQGWVEDVPPDEATSETPAVVPTPPEGGVPEAAAAEPSALADASPDSQSDAETGAPSEPLHDGR